MTDSEISAGALEVFMAGANPDHSTASPNVSSTSRSHRDRHQEPHSDSDDDRSDESDDHDDDERSENSDGSERIQEIDRPGERSEQESDEEESEPPRFDMYREGPGVGFSDDEESHAGTSAHTPHSATHSAAPSRPAFTEFMASGAREDEGRSGRHRKTEDEEAAELYDKQSMLMDLQRLKKSGSVQLSREWTMDDDVDEMSFELKRLMLHVDEVNNVAMMRNGMQLFCTGIEMMSKRYNLLDLDGWSAEVCKDMSKYERGLGRLYRKYWRRHSSASPESDIAMSLVSSMGMFHMRKTMQKRIFDDKRRRSPGPRPGQPRPAPTRRSRVVESDDDEEPPP